MHEEEVKSMQDAAVHKVETVGETEEERLPEVQTEKVEEEIKSEH